MVEQANDLLNAARAVLWEISLGGVLCRGGLAFGRIIEPEKINRGLGAFVLGEAATRAVDLEHAGKGCRLFSDVALPSRLMAGMQRGEGVGWGEGVWHTPFEKIRNPLDGSVVDEFRWYLHPEPVRTQMDWEDHIKCALIGVMRVLSLLQYSPRFRWNTASPGGVQQLAVSVDSISACTRNFGESVDCYHPADLFGESRIVRSAEAVEGNTKARISAVEDCFKRVKSRRQVIVQVGKRRKGGL